MPWLKVELSYAEGYGSPEYHEVMNANASRLQLNEIEELKSEVMAEHFDGIRTPRFSLIDNLPEAEINRRFVQARADLADAIARLCKYSALRGSKR